jgi:predicted nucleic acid-binding protein
MLKAEELVRKYPRPGRRDILCLVLAMQEKAILITGDEALRKSASLEGVEVHGTLWLLDAMVKEEAISKEEFRMASAQKRGLGENCCME